MHEKVDQAAPEPRCQEADVRSKALDKSLVSGHGSEELRRVNGNLGGGTAGPVYFSHVSLGFSDHTLSSPVSGSGGGGWSIWYVLGLLPLGLGWVY